MIPSFSDTLARHDRWPLRRTALFVVTTCGAFWTAAIFVGYHLIAHFTA